MYLRVRVGNVELTGDSQVCFRVTGFTGACPASCHHDHFLSSLFSLFRLITVRGILTWMLNSQQEISQVTFVHFNMICHQMVLLHAQVFPPEIM